MQSDLMRAIREMAAEEKGRAPNEALQRAWHRLEKVARDLELLKAEETLAQQAVLAQMPRPAVPPVVAAPKVDADYTPISDEKPGKRPWWKWIWPW